MSPPAASPSPPPAPAPPAARPQAALAVCGVVLIGLLALKGYGPRVGARPTDHHPAPVARQVDLNAAGRAELLQLPGVGPGLADAILSHRRDHGRFAAVDDLSAVKGVGGKTLDKLRPWVAVGDADEPPADPPVERLERKPVARPAVKPADVARAGKVRPGDPPVDVNSAPEAELQRLPGIGPALAGRIAAARADRPFRAADDLRRVKGIGPKTLEALRPFVTCGGP